MTDIEKSAEARGYIAALGELKEFAEQRAAQIVQLLGHEPDAEELEDYEAPELAAYESFTDMAERCRELISERRAKTCSHGNDPYFCGEICGNCNHKCRHHGTNKTTECCFPCCACPGFSNGVSPKS